MNKHNETPMQNLLNVIMKTVQDTLDQYKDGKELTEFDAAMLVTLKEIAKGIVDSYIPQELEMIKACHEMGAMGTKMNFNYDDRGIIESVSFEGFNMNPN